MIHAMYITIFFMVTSLTSEQWHHMWKGPLNRIDMNWYQSTRKTHKVQPICIIHGRYQNYFNQLMLVSYFAQVMTSLDGLHLWFMTILMPIYNIKHLQYLCHIHYLWTITVIMVNSELVMSHSKQLIPWIIPCIYISTIMTNNSEIQNFQLIRFLPCYMSVINMLFLA